MSNFMIAIISALIGILVAAAISCVTAILAMWCWNYAIVALFHAPKIIWTQAWCIMFLSQLLLKSNVTVKS
jgi:hypothetical protein